MSLERHIAIASAALERGYLDAEQFTAVVRELRRQERAQRSAVDVWVTSGILSAAQLAELVLAVDGQDGARPARSPAVIPESSTIPGRDVGHPATDLDRAASTYDNNPSENPTERSSLSQIERVRDMALEIDGDSTGILAEESIEEPILNHVGQLRYEQKQVLGVGGLGKVTSCFDGLLRRRVALKMPRTDQGRHARQVVEREARIVAGLEHPNIIPVYDAGYLPGVGPYYVMREVNQPSLAEVLHRLRTRDPEAKQTYTLRRLLRFFIQICQAVDYAHNRGVIHCDIKPGNVLLGNFGECLVVDWGLAYSPDSPSGPRGGTPGYMAPEQIQRTEVVFDPRLDVFSLGAILYAILCLEAPFPELDVQSEASSHGRRAEIRARYEKPPRPPSQVASEFEVPPEIEEVCLKALALDPAQRTASAAELAAAVEEYLEGKRELERRRVEADNYAACGDELAQRFHEFAETRPEQLASLAQLSAQIPPWAPVADKLDLWNLEDMIAVTDALQVRTLQAAMAAYEQALELIPQHEGARRGLAELHWASLDRARQERDELSELYFNQRVQQYDESRYRQETARNGSLSVVVPSGVGVTLYPLREDQRRLVRGENHAVQSDEVMRLSPGSYLIEARGRLESGPDAWVRYPVRIDPGNDQRIEIDIAPAANLNEGEIFIPGGPALLGANERAIGARQLGEVEVAPFIIQTWPVTFGDYLAFLDEQCQARPKTVAALLPRTSAGVTLLRRQGETWRRSNLGRGLSSELSRLPLFGVDVPSAEAYARWLAERTGHPYRLPRDSEWEKAARGTDGRAYPWGDYFEPTFCKMRSSRPGVSQPEPPGGFTCDESPYGVRDMAGGIADWTTPDDPADGFGAGERDPAQRLVYSRGGAWCDWPIDCRVSVRRAYWACERSRRVGFRLARSL